MTILKMNALNFFPPLNRKHRSRGNNLFPLNRDGVQKAVVDKWSKWCQNGTNVYQEDVFNLLDHLCFLHNLTVVDRSKILKNVLTLIESWLIREYKRIIEERGYTLDDIFDIVDSDMPFAKQRDFIIFILTNWEDERETVVNKPAAGLAGLAADGQNVHTTAVVQQTNANMTALLSTVVPKGQHTLDDIMNAWSSSSFIGENFGKVYEDMKAWGDKKTVIEENDYAYRKALRCAWAKIVESPPSSRKELEQRLFEECFESVGMCAQGHLSRLANVFVGFDENFKCEVSSKEAFQNAIAALAESDIVDKMSEAKKLFEDYSIVEEEQQAWLDAL